MTHRLLIITVLVLALAGMAAAVPPGKTASYPGGSMGAVTFDGKTHADAGITCNQCHPKLFQMKIGTAQFAAPHQDGTLCWSCHNGETAFATDGNCKRCHRG